MRIHTYLPKLCKLSSLRAVHVTPGLVAFVVMLS